MTNSCYLYSFIQGDDTYGCDFNTEQKNWRIVWRDEVSESKAMNEDELGKGKDGKSSEWEILWGDCGVANFFISRADLKARNFSNVYYNWDCY